MAFNTENRESTEKNEQEADRIDHTPKEYCQPLLAVLGGVRDFQVWILRSPLPDECDEGGG